MDKFKCVICEKELESEYQQEDEFGDGDTICGAGFCILSFHFGSRYDQCFGYDRRKERTGKENRLQQLLSCDQIEFFICDDCFESKHHFMMGYDLEKISKRKRIL